MNYLSCVLTTLLFVCVANTRVYGQCCAGGSGSPVAGGASQGVLMEHQLELGVNLQYVQTHRFLEETSVIRDFLDDFHSTYLYSRVAYGLSEDFTVSAELGTWLTKSQTALNHADTVQSSGIGDLVIFPRYTVYRHNGVFTNTELTFGLGVKIPVGSFDDSLHKSTQGIEYNLRKPQSVQLSNGSTDIIFYGFYFRGYHELGFNFFANALYIRKGWNPNGEKMGDFASVGLFASRKLVENLTATLQVKVEWVDRMRVNDFIANNAPPVDVPGWTGYTKLFVSPQLSYVLAPGLMITALGDIPVYQRVQGRQIASQFQASMGVSYRFFPSSDDN